ncbi:hypothetical protein SAMN04515667_1707 [Formosa sp. Hel1_31_208]|uniref:DUF6090 family protein n=1 Tax=Formosa sp. Hel1_31_208 TaxID=1798225 RepID=UPI00087CE22D|nr:DUF6090 family protein [Formosa sp. Hel1_31_208]SDS23213.1 hypothetical protein SAMN04515667_1707 [Formosa sp. Hel1_31_208]
MSENKTGKYFKYAIGEIILVVIGILIALQINNWNENKKQREFELKMLTEIQSALESDIDYFHRLEIRLQKLDSSANKFIRLVHEKATFNDTLYKNGRSRWYYLRTGINLQFNPGPYEALKSSGIDKVSNNNLRNSLVDFYDFRFPTYIAFINYYDKGYDKDVATLTSFLGKPYTESVNGEIKVYSKFPENLLEQTEFLLLLTRLKSRASNSINIIDKSIELMVELKDEINAEITK